MSKDETTTADRDQVVARDVSSMRVVRRAEIVPSKTNPRTHFDQAYLQELADNIRQHHVLQPLLVRPLPAARLQETFDDRQPGDPLPSLEIVCGECRWRACGIAQEDSIPVLIRELDDVQVLQVQLVENLKRRDLHPLEEAEGFDRLMRDHGVTVDKIADKVGKSVSYIYKTLKLLELTPECREQMFSGDLNRSVALLIARLPPALQKDGAEDAMQRDWQGELPSFRAVSKLFQERYMLQLSTAIFDIKDASLVPKAGACPSCPKRTGSNADLWDDVDKPDTCTDPKCFDEKKVAHHERIAETAKAKGQTVIQGKEAQELIANEWSTPKGYKLLDDKDYINGRHQTVRQAIGKTAEIPTPVVIVNPFTKQAMEALPITVADKLLKKAAAVKKEAAVEKDKAKEPSERELKKQFCRGWTTKAVREIYARINTGKGEAFGIGVARELALFLCRDLYAEESGLLEELLGLGKVATAHAIETHVKECPADQVASTLLLLAMSVDLNSAFYGSEDTPFISVLAGDTGVDLEAIQAEVKSDMKAAAAARKQEAKASAAPAKSAAKKASPKKKATAAEAKAGIAQALQQESASANDFEVGQAVRFKQDLKGPTGHLRKVCGRAGTVETKHGDRGWMVRYGKNKHDVAGVDYTEIEHGDAAGDDQLATAAIELANGVKLDPQPAWPFPKDPNASGQDQTLESELAKAEASGNKYRQRGLRKRIAEQEAASAEPAPNAAAAAWPFPTVAKKARKGAAA